MSINGLQELYGREFVGGGRFDNLSLGLGEAGLASAEPGPRYREDV